MVDDYHTYTEFEDFGNFYNRLVVWVSIYLENDTIMENAHFRRVSEAIRAQPISLSELYPLLSKWRSPGISQGGVEIEGKEYVITCYTMLLGESEDVLQIVGLKAYGDILEQTVHQISRSVIIFLVSVLVSVLLIRFFSRSFSR